MCILWETKDVVTTWSVCLCDGPAVSRHEDIAETSPRLLHTIHAHTPPPPPQQPHILLHAPALTTVPSVLASESVDQREDLWKLNPQGDEKRYVGARFRRWRRGLWDSAFSAIWYETAKDGSLYLIGNRYLFHKSNFCRSLAVFVLFVLLTTLSLVIVDLY